MLLLIFALLALNDAQLYSVTTYWREDSCTLTDSYFGFDAIIQRNGVLACEGTIHGCECIAGTSTCTKTECLEIEDVNILYPNRAITYSVHNTTGQNSCFGNFIGFGSLDNGECVVYTPPGSDTPIGLRAHCGVPYFTAYSSLTCGSNDGVPLGTRSGPDSHCYEYFGNFTALITCGSVCFHEETAIAYGEETHTMKTLLKNPPSACVVPHTITSNGVKITTQCEEPLRLTNQHLVFTQRGLIAAENVVKGDFIYTNLEETSTCEVLSVKPEYQQKYFGLNCEESIVLANGYKTSTFGNLHTIPALWMKYASKVFGIQTASKIGDSVAAFLHAYHLI